MDSLQTAPSLVLAAYSEDLIRGRRVVVFGNALSGLAETLVERGARLIHVYDEDPTRVAEAAARSTSASVSFAPLAPGGIAARDGAFDVGFVEELAAAADPAQLVTRLRRALSARGIGFVCTANSDVSPLWRATKNVASARGALSYYELYDLVATQFDEVRMVGQTPFAGYALADFSPDTESEFSIDTGFVPGGAEEPERYVAVCSHFPVAIEPFCVVQMEAARLVGREASVDRPVPKAKPPEVIQPPQLTELRAELAEERSAKAKLEQLLRDVNDELKRRDEWVSELESRAATADERADAAEAALERLSAKQRARAEEPRPAVDNSHELRDRERKLTEAIRKLDEHGQELATRARRISELEGTVAELENTKVKLEQAKTRAEEALSEARAKLVELEQAASRHAHAEREIADLQTTVTELREQVANLRSDLHLAGQEITRGEEQLTTLGATVKQLRVDLADTERFAALLIAERETPSADVVTSVAAPFEAEIASEVTVQSVTPVANSEIRAMDEVPSLPTYSFTERGSVDVLPPPSTPGDERRALADARAREAELQAALQSTRWTVEELEARLAEKSNEHELLERLYRAEHQLQRQATLLAQYEREARETPPAAG